MYERYARNGRVAGVCYPVVLGFFLFLYTLISYN